MNRAQKQQFVTDFGQGLSQAQAFALMSFNKLTVEQMTSFRLDLAKKNVSVQVVKNTLAKRVLAETPFKDLSKDLKGPTLIAYGADPIVTAKALYDWAGKENFDVKIKSGAALGKVVTEAEMKSLSKLPGRNELLVSFLWALKSHPTRFLYALQDTPRRLGYAVHALKVKKETEGK